MKANYTQSMLADAVKKVEERVELYALFHAHPVLFCTTFAVLFVIAFLCIHTITGYFAGWMLGLPNDWLLFWTCAGVTVIAHIFDKGVAWGIKRIKV
jgi:hypothetical protein